MGDKIALGGGVLVIDGFFLAGASLDVDLDKVPQGKLLATTLGIPKQISVGPSGNDIAGGLTPFVTTTLKNLKVPDQYISLATSGMPAELKQGRPEAYAFPALGLLAIASVFVLKDNNKKIALLLLGIVVLAGSGYAINLINEGIAKASGGQPFPAGVSAGPGIGLYLTALAGILIAAGGWKSQENAVSSGGASMASNAQTSNMQK